MAEDEFRVNEGGYGEKTTVNTQFALDADADGNFTPDERAIANAHKAQVIANAHAMIDKAESFVITAILSFDAHGADLSDVPADAEPGFSIGMVGMLDGEVDVSSELLWSSFEYSVDKFADLVDVPPKVGLYGLTSRYLAEHNK